MQIESIAGLVSSRAVVTRLCETIEAVKSGDSPVHGRLAFIIQMREASARSNWKSESRMYAMISGAVSAGYQTSCALAW